MESFILYLFIFFLGLAAGSFINCVIYRLEIGQSFLRGRSYCPDCKHQLNWPDLIPVMSFFILRGKCRHCSRNISWQYPLVEISTGLIFISILNFQFPSFNEFSIFNFLNLIYYWIIFSFLIIIFIYDLKRYIIPDKVVYPAIGTAFLYQLLKTWGFGFLNLVGIWDLWLGVLPSFLFLAIILVSRGKWMGLGDFKLAILMGLFLGFPKILVALFLAFFIGAIIGMGLIALGKKEMRSEVPFGPFLVSGAFLSLFFGDQLVSWYLNLFF